MELIIIGFIFLVIAIAIGVRLGISPLVEKDTDLGMVFENMAEIGVLTVEEAKRANKQYARMARMKANQNRSQELLKELHDLGLLDGELEDKTDVLNNYFESKYFRSKAN